MATDRNQKTLDEALERFRLAEEAEAEERREMAADLRFLALDQWPNQIRRARELGKGGARPCLTLDQIGQYRRQVLNDARNNMPQIKVRPSDSRADIKTAEVINGILRHIQSHCRASQAYLWALAGSTGPGLGYFRVLTRYISDDSWEQEIAIDPIVNPMSVHYDPYCTSLDGSGAEWAFLSEEIPKSRFKALYPKADAQSFEGSREGDPGFGWMEGEHVRVAEYFCLRDKPDELLLMDDGSAMYGSVYVQRAERGEVLGQVVGNRPVKRKRCYWHKLTAGEIIDQREFPSSHIPVIPVYGNVEWVEGKKHVWGMVRPVKDHQRGYNYTMSAVVEMTALAPRAPFIGAKGQFEGVERYWDSANVENYSRLEYNPITVQGNLVGPPQRQIYDGAPIGLVQQAALLKQDIQSALGMYNASLGAPSNEKSGVAIEQRKLEGDVGNLHYRANLGESMRQAGRILLELMPVIWDQPRVARLLGEDGAQSEARLDPRAPESRMKAPDGSWMHNITVGRYDMIIDTGPAFSSRRQEAATGMAELGRAFPAVMQAGADIMVANQDWPGAEKLAKRLKRALPPELTQGDEEGGDDVIPEELRLRIEQGIKQYESRLEEAAGMIEALQQRVVDAESSRIDGQAKLEDSKSRRIEAEAKAESMRADTDLKRAQTMQYAVPNQVLEALMEGSALMLQTLQAMQTAMHAASLPKQVRFSRDRNGNLVGGEVITVESPQQPVDQTMMPPPEGMQ